jgi:kynureninase
MRTDAHYQRALDLDLADPLRNFRDRFVLPPDIVYLDGNSLGAMPRGVKYRLNTLVEDEWGQRLVRAWNDRWLGLPTRLGEKIARLIGAEPDEVLVADSTSINFYKLAAAAAKFQNGREGVVTERDGFPTNRYILESLFAPESTAWVPTQHGVTIPTQSIKECLSPKVALMALNHVNYRSGWLHDMKDLNEEASRYGVLNLWDLSHSVGVVPIDVRAAGCDLAVGCTYKYLSGGPGAPGFLYVRHELQKALENPIHGWFGRKNFFEFGAGYEAEEDIRRFLTGTPSILSMAAIEEGLDIVHEAGVDRIRKKSELMTEFLIDIWREKLEPLDVRLNTPAESARRGSHVSLGHPHAFAIDQALIKRMAVVPDFRKPDNIRFGVSPLYNRFVEIYEALERMRLLLIDQRYRTFEELTGVVT